MYRKKKIKNIHNIFNALVFIFSHANLSMIITRTSPIMHEYVVVTPNLINLSSAVLDLNRVFSRLKNNATCKKSKKKKSICFTVNKQLNSIEWCVFYRRKVEKLRSAVATPIVDKEATNREAKNKQQWDTRYQIVLINVTETRLQPSLKNHS